MFGLTKVRDDFISELHDNDVSWDSVVDFANWYVSKGCPILPFKGREVIVIENATAIPVFQYKNFQVELYIFISNSVPMHGHPFVDLAESSYNHLTGEWSELRELYHPQSHGLSDLQDDERLANSDSMLLSFQMFPKNITPVPIASVWVGGLIGPKHAEVIKKYFPKAYFKDDFVDITRSS